MAGHDHLVVLELLSHLARTTSRDLDPGLGEESACGQGERDVNEGVNWVGNDFLESVRRRHVVGKTADGVELWAVLERLPDAEQLDEEVGRETRSEHLADDENVGSESAFKHDGHVASVEKLDGVSAALSTESVGLDGNLDSEALKVDDDQEDDEGGDQVHDVRKTVPVEGLLESSALVVPGEKQVEKSDESTFKFGTTSSVDCGWRECLPHNRFANVGGDEKGDTRAETVSLLEKLVKEDDDQAGHNELENKKKTNTSSQILGLSVKTSKDVDSGLTESDNEGEDCG